MSHSDFEPEYENEITVATPLTPAQQRLHDDSSITNEEVVYTDPDLDPDDDLEVDPASVGAYGPDVVDSGMVSDASLGGLGADLDSMPGDETPISPGRAR